MAQLRRAHPRLENAGVALAVVDQGAPEQSTEFARTLRLPYMVLADPERVAYAAFGLAVGGAKAFINPATGRALLRSVAEGTGGGRVVGDPRELGGSFVIDRFGTVRLARPARYAGDHPTVDELLAVSPDSAPA